ncbi:MAG: protein kinase [Chloroflexi bacterium]|nr:protein kinase [Chloroflexota bacterium]
MTTDSGRPVDDMNIIGKVIHGRYKIIRLISTGGFGSVYLAENTTLGTRVAIKFLSRAMAREAMFARGFIEEARSQANLHHDNTVRIFDYFDAEADLTPHFVMEYMAGGSLQDRLRSRKKYTPRDSIDFVRKISGALMEAHNRGYVHRDIKPSNILFDENEEPHLADFGIAKQIVKRASGQALHTTEVGQIKGSPPYMSPEQAAAAQTIDARSDQYSFAIVLYRMLTGGHEPYIVEDRTGPSSGNAQKLGVRTYQSYIQAHVAGSPIDIRKLREDLPPGLSNFFYKALAKEPADRFATMDEFAARYEKVAQGSRLPFAGPLPLVIAVVVLMLAVVAGVLLVNNRPSEATPTPPSVAIVSSVTPAVDATASEVAAALVPTVSPVLSDTPSPSATITPSGTPSAAPTSTPNERGTETQVALMVAELTRVQADGETATVQAQQTGTAEAVVTLEAIQTQVMIQQTEARNVVATGIAATTSRIFQDATETIVAVRTGTAAFVLTNPPTRTPLPTFTPSATSTPSATFTSSPTRTPTATFTPSNSPTPRPTDTRIPTDTPTRTPSPTPSATLTPSPHPTNTPTATPSQTMTWTPSHTPTLVPTPTMTSTRVLPLRGGEISQTSLASFDAGGWTFVPDQFVVTSEGFPALRLGGEQNVILYPDVARLSQLSVEVDFRVLQPVQSGSDLAIAAYDSQGRAMQALASLKDSALRIVQSEGTNVTGLSERLGQNLQPNTWYRLSFQLDDDSLRLTLNGELVDTLAATYGRLETLAIATDSSGLIEIAQIAVRSDYHVEDIEPDFLEDWDYDAAAASFASLDNGTGVARLNGQTTGSMMTLRNSENWTNYTIDMRVWVENAERADRPFDFAILGRVNGYGAYTGYVSLSQNSAGMYFQASDGATTPFGFRDQGLGLRPRSWIPVRMQVSGHFVAFFVNGELVSASRIGSALPGRVGIVAQPGVELIIDQFQVDYGTSEIFGDDFSVDRLAADWYFAEGGARLELLPNGDSVLSLGSDEQAGISPKEASSLQAVSAYIAAFELRFSAASSAPGQLFVDLGQRDGDKHTVVFDLLTQSITLLDTEIQVVTSGSMSLERGQWMAVAIYVQPERVQIFGDSVLLLDTAIPRQQPAAFTMTVLGDELVQVDDFMFSEVP